MGMEENEQERIILRRCLGTNNVKNGEGIIIVHNYGSGKVVRNGKRKRGCKGHFARIHEKTRMRTVNMT